MHTRYLNSFIFCDITCLKMAVWIKISWKELKIFRGPVPIFLISASSGLSSGGPSIVYIETGGSDFSPSI